MQILAIIGDPIKQAQSPLAFGAYFKKHDIEAEMVPLHVTAPDFPKVLSGLRAIRNFAGIVVTIPHKPLAYKIAHFRGPMAAATGTANVLVPTGSDQWTAEMFDGIGLITALKTRKIDTSGFRVLVIGAGGAGTAIAVALEQLGQVASISIVEPDQVRATKLAAKLQNSEIAKPYPKNYQMVVNASPVGMRSDKVPLDVSLCSPETIVCDAVMDPAKTRLLHDAEKAGCTIVKGLEMLHGQIEHLVRFLGLMHNNDV